MSQTIYTSSIEYATVTVLAKVAGVAVDLSTMTVKLAFISGTGQPTSGDWKNATWDTDTTVSPTRYTAKTLIGTGGTVLAAGTYTKWIKITDNPEVPVMTASTLVIK